MPLASAESRFELKILISIELHLVLATTTHPPFGEVFTIWAGGVLDQRMPHLYPAKPRKENSEGR